MERKLGWTKQSASQRMDEAKRGPELEQPEWSASGGGRSGVRLASKDADGTVRKVERPHRQMQRKFGHLLTVIHIAWMYGIVLWRTTA